MQFTLTSKSSLVEKKGLPEGTILRTIGDRHLEKKNIIREMRVKSGP
jgi:uncharacterized membrane protein